MPPNSDTKVAIARNIRSPLSNSNYRKKKKLVEVAFDRQPLNCAVWAVMGLTAAGHGAAGGGGGGGGRKRRHFDDTACMEGERRVISNPNGFLVE